jgi:hypothetical protein
VSVLGPEIAAYERRRTELEAQHFEEWAVFHSGEFIGVYPDFEAAANDALERFDRGPYLIRQIGVEKFVLSSTMTARPVHADRASRL